jgi:methionyl-tRNA formyltransferase
VPSLAALLAAGVEVAGVVTNPDRPAGRGMKLTPPPVKVAAAEHGIEVFQPSSARSPETVAWLEERAPDVCVVVAYGKILPRVLLDVPPLGFVNVHFSILPAYRGAAPVQRALMDGVSETGVSIMVLTEGMDEGPVLAVERTPVGERESAGEVGARLAALGGPLLVGALSAYSAGDLKPREQDHERATYAPKISAEEAHIDWHRGTKPICDLVRALNPAPGAWSNLRDRRIKVLRAEPYDLVLPPGRLQRIGEDLAVGAGDGAVRLLEVQPHGKRAMSGADLARGLRPTGDEVLR